MTPQVIFLLNKTIELLRVSSLETAEVYLKQVIKLQSNNPHALRLLGVIAIQRKQYLEAVNYLHASLKYLPKNPLTESNLGTVFHCLKDYQNSLEAYDRSIKLEPKYEEAWSNKGNVLLEIGCYEEALYHYDKAISLKPHYAEAWSNKGNVLRMLNRHEEAINNYHQALALNPNDHIAWNNKGFALNELRYFDKALTHFDQALSLNPDYHEATFNKSLVLLLRGDYENGLSLYESRWSINTSDKPFRSDIPVWLGNGSLEGKAILLYGEQGLGDFIQFCRYAKLASDLGGRVILEVPAPLVGLLSSLGGVSQIVVKGEGLPILDYQCPLLSLPLAFKTSLDSIPSEPRYLSSNPDVVMEWMARLGERTKPRVGLVWSGNPDHKNDHNRSLKLKDLLPCLPEHCDYFSLQKEVRETDALTLEKNPRIRSFAKHLQSFSDTAALIECLDLVISVDTSVAHLSGALGKKTWVLLPYTPDWRWHLDRSDSAWYPSVSLYRQERIGDWNGALEKVRIGLLGSFLLM